MRSGRVIASADQSAIGRGLASFGQSLAAIGEDRKRSNLALEATQADGGATGALYDLERSFENETDYQNFGQRFEAETQKIKATQGAKITDPLKRKLWEAEFDKQKQAARDRVLTLGQNREKENFAVLARDSLMEYQRVFADPDVPAEERNRAKASADASIRVLQQEGVLSPEKASEWRKAVIEGGEFIFAQREIERNPGVISAGKIASGPVGQVITEAANRYGVSPDALMRVAMIESGGNPAAKNPNSSAGGLFQFIDSTARQYGLSNKFDAAQSADAAARLMRDNATYLRKTLNREPTAGELYLAHQQGAGGAAKLLANPNALAVDVIGYEAVRLNGGAPGMTAGQFAEKWTRKMDGASAKLPDWYTNADADTQLKYEEMAAARERQLQIEADANLKAQQEARNDDYRLRIANGDTTLSALDINTDPYLDDGKKATLINELNSKRGDEISTAAAMEAFMGGSLSVDPYSTDGRKTVDNVDAALSKTVPEEMLPLVREELVRQSGIVPERYQSVIRQGLDSTAINDVIAAASAASRIAAISPTAWGRRDGGENVMKAATAFEHYTRVVGLTPEQAAQRMIDARDPQKMLARDALMKSKTVTDFVKRQAVESTVRDIFDPGILGMDPELGTNPAEAAAMVGEYRSILEESIIDANGDQDLAKSLAGERFARRYSQSDFTIAGSGVVSRLPPERTYQAGPDGTLNYVREQAFEVLREEGIEADQIYLEPYDETEKDFRSGKPARYQLFYERDGNLEQLNVPFYAVMPTGAAVFDENRTRWEENKALKERIDKTLEGSGMQNNPIMSDDPNALR